MVCDLLTLPRPFRVVDRTRELSDVVTLSLEPGDGGPPVRFEPGQFSMLYAFGVGEAPISLSGSPDDARAVHTVRAVGSVTRALCKLKIGDTLGLRGPYGSAWPVDRLPGGDVLVIAGGIGLAPLRSAVRQLLAGPRSFARLRILYGARTPDDLLYPNDRRAWEAAEGVRVLTIVDAAGEGWAGAVGVVPALVPRSDIDPANTTALVCGPEIMIRHTLRALEKAGVPEERVYVSLERRMGCAVGLCGSCQLGAEFVCMDGPVFPSARVSRLLAIPEL